mmetsp:Transcript_30816/g.71017  ORF Transcript_30816/g.71017 Transcript_30816/m.71017 type:complete len:239 (+) Transcript_30816:553-1269(+)
MRMELGSRGFFDGFRHDRFGNGILVRPKHFDMSQCHSPCREGIIVDFGRARGDLANDAGFANVGTPNQYDGRCIQTYTRCITQRLLQLHDLQNIWRTNFVKQITQTHGAVLHGCGSVPGGWSSLGISHPILASFQNLLSSLMNIVQDVLQSNPIFLLARTSCQFCHNTFKRMQPIQFRFVSLDYIPERYTQCLCQSIERFGPMFSGSIPCILDGRARSYSRSHFFGLVYDFFRRLDNW